MSALLGAKKQETSDELLIASIPLFILTVLQMGWIKSRLGYLIPAISTGVLLWIGYGSRPKTTK